MTTDSITDYESAVQTLEEIEQGDLEHRTMLIDIKEALASQIPMKEYDYDKACQEIARIEGIGRVEQQPFAITQKQAVAAPKPSMSKETFDAAKEIKRIVGGAGKGIESIIGKEEGRIRKGKLVLPKLSLQDQIHELEGINEGLGNKAFNPEQLSIIGSEIGGLNESVKYEKVVTGDEFQKSLIELRDKLLAEVEDKLKNN